MLVAVQHPVHVARRVRSRDEPQEERVHVQRVVEARAAPVPVVRLEAVAEFLQLGQPRREAGALPPPLGQVHAQVGELGGDAAQLRHQDVVARVAGLPRHGDELVQRAPLQVGLDPVDGPLVVGSPLVVERGQLLGERPQRGLRRPQLLARRLALPVQPLPALQHGGQPVPVDHLLLQPGQRRGRRRQRLAVLLERGLHVVRERVQQVVARPRGLVVGHRRHPPVEAPRQRVARRGPGPVATARQVREERVAPVCGRLLVALAQRGLVPPFRRRDPRLQSARLLEEAPPPRHPLQLLEDDARQAGPLPAGVVQRVGHLGQRGLRPLHHLAPPRNRPLDHIQAVPLLLVDRADAALHLGERPRDRILVHPRQVELGQRPHRGRPALAALRHQTLQLLDLALLARHTAPHLADPSNQRAVHVSSRVHGYHLVIWPRSSYRRSAVTKPLRLKPKSSSSMMPLSCLSAAMRS